MLIFPFNYVSFLQNQVSRIEGMAMKEGCLRVSSSGPSELNLPLSLLFSESPHP